MSMNIHIEADREIEIVKTGKRETQTIFFDEWQTPTEVSKHIMAQPDRIQAYIDWVMAKQVTETVPVYAESDLFGEGEPIGFEEFNYGAEHVELLKEWIRQAEEEGYEVTVSMM